MSEKKLPDNVQRAMDVMKETLEMCGALAAGCPEPSEHNISEIKAWLDSHELAVNN